MAFSRRCVHLPSAQSKQKTEFFRLYLRVNALDGYENYEVFVSVCSNFPWILMNLCVSHENYDWYIHFLCSSVHVNKELESSNSL